MDDVAERKVWQLLGAESSSVGVNHFLLREHSKEYGVRPENSSPQSHRKWRYLHLRCGPIHTAHLLLPLVALWQSFPRLNRCWYTKSMRVHYSSDVYVCSHALSGRILCSHSPEPGSAHQDMVPYFNCASPLCRGTRPGPPTITAPSVSGL